MQYLSLIVYLVAIGGGLVQTLLFQEPAGETMLTWLLPALVGFSGIWAFMGHAWRSNETAKYIGWKPGSPFQLEVAYANLSYGILGILSIWFREGFWLATIIAYTVFMWSCAYNHLKEKKNGNKAPGNAGFPLIIDIIIPIILIVLYTLYINAI